LRAGFHAWEGEIDIQIFNERVRIIILIGEENGATGSKRFWDEEYWKKAEYEREFKLYF